MKWLIKKIDLVTAVAFILLICILGALLFPSFERKFIYKKSYNDLILKYSEEYETSPHLSFAVMKAESGFDKNAVSRAGAVGLMQIRLPTAVYIAEMLGETVEIKDLKEPKTNIKYGIFYLKYLSGKYPFESEILAAYNAGEGTVNEWLRDKKYSDDGLTLKAIPFKETKKYVKKVTKYKEKYDKLYN